MATICSLQEVSLSNFWNLFISFQVFVNFRRIVLNRWMIWRLTWSVNSIPHEWQFIIEIYEQLILMMLVVTVSYLLICEILQFLFWNNEGFHSFHMELFSFITIHLWLEVLRFHLTQFMHVDTNVHNSYSISTLNILRSHLPATYSCTGHFHLMSL